MSWEIDLVDAAKVESDQISLFPGLEETLLRIGSKQISHAQMKVQLVHKAIKLTLVSEDGETTVLDAQGGEIRYARLPVTEKAKTQVARIVLGSIPYEKAEALCRCLGRNVQVKVVREKVKPDLKIVNDELPEDGALVGGVDSGGEVRLGMVVTAEKGAIQIDDFGDNHVLKEVATVTELLSDDDTDIDDHLGRFAAEVEEMGHRPTFAVLMEAVVRTGTDGKVQPATATTTFVNAAVIDNAVQSVADTDLPTEAGEAGTG